MDRGDTWPQPEQQLRSVSTKNSPVSHIVRDNFNIYFKLGMLYSFKHLGLNLSHADFAEDTKINSHFLLFLDTTMSLSIFFLWYEVEWWGFSPGSKELSFQNPLKFDDIYICEMGLLVQVFSCLFSAKPLP